MDEFDQLVGYSAPPQATSASASQPLPTPGGGIQPQPAAPPPKADVHPDAALDFDRLLNDGHAVDQNLGEKIPLKFSGNTPDTAQNKSPLTSLDRLKLSMGNQAGNINYLQERFGKDGVRPITGEDGKPSQDLAVKQNDTWYRVNPKNGDIQDPWEATKEYMQDAADFAAPMAVGYTASAVTTAFLAPMAAAATMMTGGAAAPGTIAGLVGAAGAAQGLARTSLGRLVGTYDATPAEQAWDVAFESLLNIGGHKFLMGVKPTAKVIANKLGDLSEVFADTIDSAVEKFPGLKIEKSGGVDVNNMPKALFKKIFANYSVGEVNFDTMVENPDRVKATMRQLYDASGGNTSAYHDRALAGQLENIKDIADGSRTALSSIYGSMRNRILADVPENFSVNLDDAVYGAYSKAIQNGLGELTVGGKRMVGKEAIDYLAANSEKGLANAGFRLFTPDEMGRAIAGGAGLDKGLGTLAADNEAHVVLDEYYKNLGRFIGGQNRTGVDGAKALLDFKKVATELSYKMADTEAARSTPTLKMLIDQGKSAMDDSVFQALKKHGLGDQFASLNKTYSDLSKEFAPLLSAQKAYIKQDNVKVYEGLLNQFLARPGKSVSTRFAIDAAIDAADKNGLKSLAQDLTEQKLSIQVAEAAKAFNPIKPGYLKADALGAGGVAMLQYAMYNHNPAIIAAAAGTQILRSPKTAEMAIATTRGLGNGQQYLSSLTKSQLNKFISDPAAIQKFVGTVTSTPLIYNQAEGAINNAVMQTLQKATGPTQGQPQQ